MASSAWALALLALALLSGPPPEQGWLCAAQSTRKVLQPDMNQGPRRAQQSGDGSGRAAASASTAGAGSSLDPGGFPGTAVDRMSTALSMIANITQPQLDGDWGDIRRSLLLSCGLTDSRNAIGRGRTTHCFADCASRNRPPLAFLGRIASDRRLDCVRQTTTSIAAPCRLRCPTTRTQAGLQACTAVINSALGSPPPRSRPTATVAP